MNSQGYTIEELLELDSFRKWVRGEASRSQKEYWDHWVTETDENRVLARNAMKEMAGFTLDPNTSPNTDKAWSRFNKRLNPEGKIVNHKAPKESSGQMVDLKWIYRMAAGFLIILTAGLSVYLGYSEDNSGSQSENVVTNRRVLTDYGEQKTIQLGDGSLINLNSNSELVYSVSSANPTDITINLRGEAFFSVSERTSQNQFPFRVVTEDGSVRVLGTEFSVSTRDEKTQVVLEKGRVEVTSYQAEQQKRRQLILKPNHMAEFDNTSDTLLVKWVNTAVYTSWKTEDLVFDHTPLPEVLKRIEYTFGVTIKIKDPALKQRTLSGTIENSKMNVILSTLSQTLSTPVEIDGEIVYIGKENRD
ncbi:FecR domain-containing protein [Aliifodinibius sp. S!AR15-10]|uniref:FecR family protein n=1 Tax=Aliifodinibius sp. S!AR15-10 TaxID=2950437 RepID=UPI0028587036|nr:FecR domain-containing protein [Aliifodinibius sp. S!AR15-10]MDR8392941.1 FecR domain-containing protein [Aliifodinibius sp. S!AR15-10]